VEETDEVERPSRGRSRRYARARVRARGPFV
jgi:hypothetical protein